VAPDPDLAGDLALGAGPFVLRPLEPGDAAEIFAEFADPRVVEYMDIDPLDDLSEAEAIIQWAQNLRALGAGVRWSIRERAGGGLVGTCGFNALVVERGRRGEVAYDLRADAWGRGVMRAVLPVLVDFGFDRLGLHRLEAMVTPGNARSCRLLERHGFAREGVLAGYGFWKGRYWDQIVFGLTR
jgi:ribosomal-protein-alanine N-acetyltransferase